MTALCACAAVWNITQYDVGVLWNASIGALEIVIVFRCLQVAYTDLSVDEDGVSVRGLFGTRSMSWRECSVLHHVAVRRRREQILLHPGIFMLFTAFVCGLTAGMLQRSGPMMTFMVVFQGAMQLGVQACRDASPRLVRRWMVSPTTALAGRDGAPGLSVPAHLAETAAADWAARCEAAGVEFRLHSQRSATSNSELWTAVLGDPERRRLAEAIAARGTREYDADAAPSAGPVRPDERG